MCFESSRQPTQTLSDSVCVDMCMHAMENTKSNSEAARFLKVSFTTYKKYAKHFS